MAKRELEEAPDAFGLGYVAEPLPGHEPYRGMLAIPYLRFPRGFSDKDGWFVVSLRFRCLLDHEHVGHGKYNTESGDRPRLYNTVELTEAHDRVAITEGEIDAMTATLAGIPAIGVPGATSWREWFREPFLGYETVHVLADGDTPGRTFARQICQLLPNAKLVSMPDGVDVNKLVVSEGPEGLERLLV